MNDILKDRMTAAMNDDSVDKWGKKGHTATVLSKIASETVKPDAVLLDKNANYPGKGSEAQPSLTQLIANDMRHLVVQEAYDLAEGIVRTHKPDLNSEELKTETIELMLTLNKWCRQIT